MLSAITHRNFNISFPHDIIQAMLDTKILRETPQVIKKALENRGANVMLLENFAKIDVLWRKALAEVETMKAEKNAKSQEIPKLKAAKQDATKLLGEMKILSDEITKKETALKDIEKELEGVTLYIPNIPHSSVPVGIDATQNKEVRKWGEPRHFEFKAKAHDELGEKLGILNFAQGAKIGGSLFTADLARNLNGHWSISCWMCIQRTAMK
jgi:seryl-tRNA synthetase